MKNLYILLTLVLFSSCRKHKEIVSIALEADPIYFTFNGEMWLNDNSTLVSYDNNLILCGNNDKTITIHKISKSGQQVWRKDFDASNNSDASAIVQSPSNDLFICGKSLRYFPAFSYEMLLVKMSSDGDTIWTKTYGGDNDDYGSQIINTNDGNLLLCGYSYSYQKQYLPDIYLIKVNYNGDTLWTRTYQGPNSEGPCHVIETQNGEYLITGVSRDTSQRSELYFLKVDVNGAKLWSKVIGTPKGSVGYSTIELSNGDLMSCGLILSTGNNEQVLLLKTNNLGNEIWQKEFGERNSNEKGNSIKQNLDGTFTITGSSLDITAQQEDILLLKVDQNGNQIWLKNFGGDRGDWGMTLVKDSNDDNIITGTTYSYGYNPTAGNLFMIKTDNNGNFK